MVKEVYKNNPLAQNLLKEIQLSDFGDHFKAIPIVNRAITKQIDTTIRHLDNKAKIIPEKGYATVFEGLEFDETRVRSQAVAIYDQRTKQPVAVSTFIIAPTSWVANKRYFENMGDGIVIRDFKSLTPNRSLPKFLFFPGWTYVDPSYRLQFAIPGFRAIKKIITFIKSLSPSNTWMEEIPRGIWPRNREQETIKIAANPIGTFVATINLPFELNTLGRNSFGSSSSVKIAKHLGLEKAENMSSVNTLGPIYTKQFA